MHLKKEATEAWYDEERHILESCIRDLASCKIVIAALKRKFGSRLHRVHAPSEEIFYKIIKDMKEMGTPNLGIVDGVYISHRSWE